MQKNLSIENLLDEYYKALNATYSTHDASEYSYRSALENLLNSLLQPEYQAINEPRNMTCGKPDISIIRKRDAVNCRQYRNQGHQQARLRGKRKKPGTVRPLQEGDEPCCLYRLPPFSVL